MTNQVRNAVVSCAMILSAAAAADAQTKHLQFPPTGAAAVRMPAGPMKDVKPMSFRGAGLKSLSGPQIDAAATASGLPLMFYNFPAMQDGNRYAGYIVGARPGTSSPSVTVTTWLVPLRFHFFDASGNEVLRFNPVVGDSCLGGRSPLTLTETSPIFRSVPFTMNGVNVGNTQYIDAFRRADMWSIVQNTDYHLLLAEQTTTPIDIDVSYGSWAYGVGTCSYFGAIDIGLWDAFTQFVLLPYIGVTPDIFPIFLTHNVAFTVGGGCCALGYHNATVVNTNAQTYSSSDFDSSGFLPPDYNDTLVLSHEVAEWADDPLILNLTPPWGNTGQVFGCQGNLEVGDPLTPVAFPPVTLNGFTYHLQELAFFTWFYGGPWHSAGGVYSNNGTFTVPAMLCQ